MASAFALYAAQYEDYVSARCAPYGAWKPCHLWILLSLNQSTHTHTHFLHKRFYSMKSLSTQMLPIGGSSLISRDNQSSTIGALGSESSPLTVSAALETGSHTHSHSHTWLLSKVLVRSLFSILLVSSMVLYVASHPQAYHQPLQNNPDLLKPFRHQRTGASCLKKHDLYGDMSENAEHPRDYSEASPINQNDGLLMDRNGNRCGSLCHSMEQYHTVSAIPNRLVMSYRPLKSNRKLPKPNMKSLLKIFQDLSDEGLLKRHHKILCLDYKAGKEVVALKKRGYGRAVGISLGPLVLNTYMLTQNLADESFDFFFTRIFDEIAHPALFVAEVERILRVGGFAALQVSLDVWRNKFISSKHVHGMKPVTLLFQLSKIVYVSAAYARGLDTIIVFKKTIPISSMIEVMDLAHIDQKESHVHASIPQVIVDNTAQASKSPSVVDNTNISSQAKVGTSFLYTAKGAWDDAGGSVHKVLSRVGILVDSLVKDVSNGAWARKLMI